MLYICQFCNNKFSTKKVQIVCPICGEDFYIEKLNDVKLKNNIVNKKTKGNEK